MCNEMLHACPISITVNMMIITVHHGLIYILTGANTGTQDAHRTSLDVNEALPIRCMRPYVVKDAPVKVTESPGLCCRLASIASMHGIDWMLSIMARPRSLFNN